MRKATQLILALTVAVSAAACERPAENTAPPASTAPAADARPTGTSGQSADAQQFVNDLGSGNMTEIDLGRMAQQKAVALEVRAFAEMLVRDHTKALDALEQAAAQLNLQVPAMVNEKHRQLRDRLSMLTGSEFDREFIGAMIDAHEATVKKLENRKDAGADALQQFASTILPTVQQHLEQAKQIRDRLTT